MTASPPPATPARLVVGIDLGTTNSLAAVMGRKGPVVLRDADGEALIPSVVCFAEGQVRVGREAKALEFLRTRLQRIGLFRRPVRRLELSKANAALLVELSFNHAVEPAGAMRTRFPLQRQAGVVSPARTKTLGGDVLRRRSEAMAHILARDN